MRSAKFDNVNLADVYYKKKIILQSQMITDDLSPFERLVLQEWSHTKPPHSLNAFIAWHTNFLVQISNLSEAERREYKENVAKTWLNVCLRLQEK